MELVSKTRGGSSPQGKPRVYLTGHPEDVARYFDPVADEILAAQNCAVYRLARPEGAVALGELEEELEQMQLLVVLVTRRLLEQPGHVRSAEFPFARDRHIPVLPLMLEPGLEEDFDRAWGNIQTLSRYGGDMTGASYEQRLKKFLDAVLVGDDLAEQVRGAFLARIFISYRKKDYRQLQQLIRLIHSQEFCQDIAIWYDELLTPGEDFNEGIDAALRGSDLFLLAVTPHVLEADNYVASIEYPTALEANKPVLPVELEPTDPEALRASFQDLPPCASTRDEGGLRQSLLEAVQGLHLPREEATPERDYAIGLAYLNGIGVEVNRALGLARITRAAEGGLPEAMEKLAGLYWTGSGVARDYTAATYWLERLVETRWAQFEEIHTTAMSQAWMRAIIELGDRWMELAEYGRAREAFQRAYRVGKLSCEFQDDPDNWRVFGASCDRLRSLAQAEGRTEEAEGWQAENLAINRRLCQQEGTMQDRRSLAIDLFVLGTCRLERGDWDGARAYYQECMEIRQAICRETREAWARQELAVIENSIGRLCQAEGELEQAEDWYRKGLAILEPLCEENPAHDLRRSLATSYNDMGRVYSDMDRPGEAKGWYGKSAECWEELYREGGLNFDRKQLAILYHSLGFCCRRAGTPDEVADWYGKELALRLALWERQPSALEAQRIASLYADLASIQSQRGEVEQALTGYRQSLEWFERCAEAGSERDFRGTAALCLGAMGAVELALGRREEAWEHLQKAVAADKALLQETGDPNVKGDLSSFLTRIGLCLADEGREEEALGYYDQALGLRWELCEQRDRVEDQDEVAVLSYLVAQCTTLTLEQRYSACIQARDIHARLSAEEPRKPRYASQLEAEQAYLEQLEQAMEEGQMDGEQGMDGE